MPPIRSHPACQGKFWRGTDLGFTWYRIRQSPLTLVGLAIFALVLTVIIFAPVIAPFPPDAVDLAQRLAPDHRLARCHLVT